MFHPVNGREVEILPNCLLVVESKNGKPRKIPMHPLVRETILRLARDTGCEGEIFSYNRNGVSDMTIRTGFEKACKVAQIPYGQADAGGIVWHDLRHTFATRLREQGTRELEIMQLMGHSTPTMTRSYAHSTHRVLEEAVSQLSLNSGEIFEVHNQKPLPRSRHFHVIGGKATNWLKTEVTVTL